MQLNFIKRELGMCPLTLGWVAHVASLEKEEAARANFLGSLWSWSQPAPSLARCTLFQARHQATSSEKHWEITPYFEVIKKSSHLHRPLFPSRGSQWSPPHRSLLQFWISSYASGDFNYGPAILDVGVCEAYWYNNSIPTLGCWIVFLQMDHSETDKPRDQPCSFLE